MEFTGEHQKSKKNAWGFFSFFFFFELPTLEVFLFIYYMGVKKSTLSDSEQVRDTSAERVQPELFVPFEDAPFPMITLL